MVEDVPVHTGGEVMSKDSCSVHRFSGYSQEVLGS